MGIFRKLWKKKRIPNYSQEGFYELTYIVEGSQKERLSELARRFRDINGWNEKQLLQFAVTAMHKEDLDAKLQFLENILKDLSFVPEK